MQPVFGLDLYIGLRRLQGSNGCRLAALLSAALPGTPSAGLQNPLYIGLYAAALLQVALLGLHRPQWKRRHR